MICKWENLSRDQINELDKDKCVILIPLSSTEQHGPHLPVGTDKIILESLIEGYIQKSEITDANLIFSPLITIGKSNEHFGFSGTMSFSAQTYYLMIMEMAQSIKKSGFKKIVLFNSHGGNTDMLNMISRDIRIELDLCVFVFDWWFTPFWAEGLEGLKQSGKYGVFHACELETSLMLHIMPETVNMALAVDEDPTDNLKDNSYVTILGPFTAGWKTSDITKSGVIGAPTYATKEKGQKLFDFAIRKLDDILKEIIKTNY